MAFKLFTIPIRDEGAAVAELNAFLRSHRVLGVDRRWVDQGTDSFWSFCLDYVDVAASSTPERSGRNRGKDYREVLSADEFTLFAKLRDLRKEIGQEESVPVYTIFTNEQLAQMVQSGVNTKAALEKIPGVGEARIDKYGTKFLRLLADAVTKDGNEADRETV